MPTSIQVILGKHLDGESVDLRQIGKTYIGTLTTGPRGFLSWFGTQLGVISQESTHERIIAYQRALTETKDGFFAASFAKDPFGVAQKLLKLRDDMHLAAPSHLTLSVSLKSLKTFPRLQALAIIEAKYQKHFPHDGQAEILQKIILRLKAGQKSPITSLHFIEDPAHWSTRWQELWSVLAGQSVSIENHEYGAAVDCEPTKKDIVHYKSSFLSEAAETVAAFLAVTKSGTTVVIRGKEPRALDLALNRIGQPSLGHAEGTSSHPAAAILPIVIGLSCAPTDPNMMLRFAELSLAPVPKGLRSRISSHVYDSSSWQKSPGETLLKEYLDSLKDHPEYSAPESSKIAEWQNWLNLADENTTEMVTSAKLLANIAQLDIFLSTAIRNPSVNDETRAALAIAKNDAQKYAEILNLSGKTNFSRSEIHLLLGKVQSNGTLRSEREAGQVVAVDHPSALLGPADTVIYWMGIDSTAPSRPWKFFTVSETKSLADIGILFANTDIEFDEHAAAARRALSLATSRFILVTSESLHGEPTEPLPLWHEINGKLPAPLKTYATQQFLEEFIPNPNTLILETKPKPSLKFQATWNIAPGTIQDRPEESPSSLEKLTGCPYSYVLTYTAGLQDPADWSVEADNRLSGNLSEEVLSAFFEGGGQNQTEAKQRESLAKIFDHLFAKEAGILMVGGLHEKRLMLKEETIEAGIYLATVMTNSGYSYESSQVPLTDDTAIGLVSGTCDFVFKSTRSKDQRIIIDTKYGGLSYRESTFKQGFSIQLAIYSRLMGKGRSWPKTAYFIISKKRLITSHEDLFDGVKAINAPHEEQIWKQVEKASSEAKSAFKSGLVSVGIPAKTVFELEGTGRLFPASCGFCKYNNFCRDAERNAI